MVGCFGIARLVLGEVMINTYTHGYISSFYMDYVHV